jgi:hypothetical protein
MSERAFAQVHLAPLLRAEARYLLGEVSIGFLVRAQDGMTTHHPGIHAVERGAVVILTFMTPDLEELVETGQPVTYAAESVDPATGAGWHVTVTGAAEFVVEPALRAHYQELLPGFEPGDGTHLLRLHPRLIDGHRFQRPSDAL